MRSAARLCSFTVGEGLFGLEVGRVQEVLRSSTATRIPLARPLIRGLLNLRGQIVLAVDLRLCLGLGPAPPGSSAMNLVLATDDGPVSFVVDAIHDVVDVDPIAIQPPPDNLDAPRRALVRGTFFLDDRLALLLDADAVLALIDAPEGDGDRS